MVTATILAIFVSIIYAITKAWGAWYSLSGPSQHRKSTMMPILLAGPRFMMTVGVLLWGLWGLDWDSDAQASYVSITMLSYILLTIIEIMYVQTKLRKKEEDVRRTIAL